MTRLIPLNKDLARRTYGLTFPTLFPSDIFQEFDKVVSQLLDFDGEHSNLSLRKGFPKGDVYLDQDGNTVIELALAGYSKEQLSVKIEDNSLVVSGGKQEDEVKDTKGRSLARRAFTTEFPNFTNEWNLQAADVNYKDGLLRIVVPRVQQEVKTVRELEIK